jgi:hypothetical protein
MRERLALVLCIVVATTAGVVTGEMLPYAPTARPGGDITVRPDDPVPFNCEDPCIWRESCDVTAGGSSTDSWIADLEYDEYHNVMWMVEVCGDYGVEAWDYDNPCELVYDCEYVTGYCERGIAYDPVENRLYVSNWSSGVVYKLDPDDFCAQTGYCDLNYLGYPYYSVAGLAYDENHGVIWVMTNSAPDYLFAIYPFADGFYGNCSLAPGFYDGPMPWGCFTGDYKGGGIDYDKVTNELYAQNQANQWSGTYTEIFDVGDGSSPTFVAGCINYDDEGLFYGWGIGTKDGAFESSDDMWVSDINDRPAPPCTLHCQSYEQPDCQLEVIGYQSEVPPGIKATLDLLVKTENNTCMPVTADMMFEFYRGIGCQGDPIKTLTKRDVTAPCGESCHIAAWGPVPSLPYCNWYSVKVTFDAFDPPCEDCWDFHIGDPTPVISESIEF